MLRHKTKIILATAGIVGVLGAGVAVADTTGGGTCPYGNTPQAGQAQRADSAKTGMQRRLGERDGTGPRHAQQAQQRRGGEHRRGAGQGPGNRGADCPYRS